MHPSHSLHTYTKSSMSYFYCLQNECILILEIFSISNVKRRKNLKNIHLLPLESMHTGAHRIISQNFKLQKNRYKFVVHLVRFNVIISVYTNDRTKFSEQQKT